jgi:hypothetical protein
METFFGGAHPAVRYSLLAETPFSQSPDKSFLGRFAGLAKKGVQLRKAAASIGARELASHFKLAL